MNHSAQLALAISIAAQSHLHQQDKGGRAYILHPLTVMFDVGVDDCLLAAMAVLHDVIEDDANYTLEHLNAIGFGQRIVAGLALLSHDKSVSYEDYIDNIINSGNLDAMRVKQADLRHNSDITRLKGLRDKDFDRMRKYCISYQKISNAIKSITTL